MNIFDNYAEFYDLFYHDKNYQAEANYVDGLIKKYSSGARSIFEMGSGTGTHALLLAEMGYQVYGIDISERMVEMANQRLAVSTSLSNKIKFDLGDIRSTRLNKKFDVVISLFHVFSYQTKNEDLVNSIETASQHLNKDGLLIFDCWYGPAVLTNQPEVRIKRVESNDYLITRISEPKHNLNENIIDVYFDVFVQDKKNKQIGEFKEVHSMRYFFKPELEIMLKQQGFELLDLEEWITGKTPNKDSWGVCFVCRKIK